MEVLLMGIGIWLITELTKYLRKITGINFSSKYVVVLLSLLGWAIFYTVNTYYPTLREQAIKFAWGAFAVSQAIWMLLEKYVNNKPIA